MFVIAIISQSPIYFELTHLFVSCRGQLIAEEDMEVGRVKLSVYWKYFKQVGIKLSFFILLCYIIFETFQVLARIWLSVWTSDSLKPDYTDLVNYRVAVYATFGFLSGMLGLYRFLNLQTSQELLLEIWKPWDMRYKSVERNFVAYSKSEFTSLSQRFLKFPVVHLPSKGFSPLLLDDATQR